MNMISRGFTLIEVLIASFIMFISLAAFTLVFRTTILSSEKAELNVSSAAYTTLIISKITFDLKNSHSLNEKSGSGELMGRHYQWQARVKETAKPPARYFGNSLSQAEHQAKLWQVKLEVKVNGKNSDFLYEEITW
ncbi:MAG: prepilin-type N-terminal cleavage/methylation domain-containing protein [Thalassotalea sp.]|nr:prepilin-type N-terminal cleavage/methylation domain-containing protein [Thalassotalea sp.]